MSSDAPLSFTPSPHRYVVDLLDLAERPTKRIETVHVLGFTLDPDGYLEPVVLFEGGGLTAAALERDHHLVVDYLREDDEAAHD